MYTRLYVLVEKKKDILIENKIIGIYDLYDGQKKLLELNNLYCENIYKLEGPFSVNINSNKLLNNNLFPEVNIPNYKPMPNFPHPDIFPDSPK
jgi:hypothetical protein